MGLKGNAELLLSLLLISALCVGAEIIPELYTEESTMTWMEARQHCRGKNLDLATLDDVGAAALVDWLEKYKVRESVWIGLHRDPQDEKTWKWIDQSSAEGLSSQAASVNWMRGAENGHCAAVRGDRFMWYSEGCSAYLHICCSNKTNIACKESVSTSWQNTKRDCEEVSMALPTITAENAHRFLSNSWIGLYREGGDSWKWDDGTPVEYTNWAEGEPRTRDCGSFCSSDELSSSHECSEKLRPVCFGDNLLVVKLEKTWEEAMRHCQELETACPSESCVYHYNLLMPHDATEHAYVARRVQRAGISSEVWVGLRFLAGKWWRVDEWTTDHHLTLPDCPSQRERCAAGHRDTRRWLLRDCSERKYFVCRGYKVSSGNESQGKAVGRPDSTETQSEPEGEPEQDTDDEDD